MGVIVCVKEGVYVYLVSLIYICMCTEKKMQYYNKHYFGNKHNVYTNITFETFFSVPIFHILFFILICLSVCLITHPWNASTKNCLMFHHYYGFYDWFSLFPFLCQSYSFVLWWWVKFSLSLGQKNLHLYRQMRYTART